jgi:hypothetical protein
MPLGSVGKEPTERPVAPAVLVAAPLWTERSVLFSYALAGNAVEDRHIRIRKQGNDEAAFIFTAGT